MSTHTPGKWDYISNINGTYSVYSRGERSLDDTYGFGTNILAEVLTEGVIDPEANARLIAAAPELKVSLIGALEALEATAEFMSTINLQTEDLHRITGTISELLDRIDG